MHRALLLLLLSGCIVEVKNSECVGEECNSPAETPDADLPPGNCADESEFYLDADEDGFGDPASTMLACETPAGHTDNRDDCDDDQANVNPLASEVCGDKIDNDCSGADACEQALLGHWDFSESMLDIAVDVSGNGHDASLLNGAAIADGIVQFDGIDDYAEVPHAPAFAIADGSLSLGFVLQQADVRQGLWSKDSSGLDAGGHLDVMVQVDNSVRVRLQDPTASHVVTSAPLAVGELHHLAFTFGANGMQFYVDGTLVASDPFAGGIEANPEPTIFGASASQSGDGVATPIVAPANASLSEVRLHSRALSAAEVAELFAISISQ